MANDGGLMARLEQRIVDILAALTNSGKNVFKTADVWRHQVGAISGGIEAFDGYEPFAFVSYQSADADREGSDDLEQIFEFAVLIGVGSKYNGVARTGNSNNLGTSKIRDLVIASLDKVHPGEGFTCEEFRYTGEIEIIDSPKRHAIQMNFQVKNIGA